MFRVVACSPLVIVGMLDGGAVVAVRCGSVCSVNGASKRGKESGNMVAGRVAFDWASGVRNPEIG